jgi:hypothetical protein
MRIICIKFFFFKPIVQEIFEFKKIIPDVPFQSLYQIHKSFSPKNNQAFLSLNFRNFSLSARLSGEN